MTCQPIHRCRIAGADCRLTDDADRAMIETLLRGRLAVEHTYKSGERGVVERYTFAGRSWVAKRYHGRPFKRWLLRRFGLTAGRLEWSAAHELLSHGVRVCRPVALIEQSGIRGAVETLVMPHVDGRQLHHCIRDDSPPGRWTVADRARRRAIADAVGRQIGLLAAAGFTNRDHKASNILIDAATLAPGGQPVLIDVPRPDRRRGDEAVWRMFARLGETALKAGHITMREQLRCVRAALRADATLARGQRCRLRAAAEAIDRFRAASSRG